MNSLVVASCVVLALLQMTSHAWKFSPSLIRQNKILTAGINMPLFLSAKDANEIFDDDITNGGKAKKTPHSKGRPAKAKNVQVVVSAENNIKQTATDNMPANTEKSPMHVESSVHEVFDKNPLPLSAEGRAWFPVTLLDTIDDKLPKQVELLGTKYVVWRNQANKYNRTASFGWNVMLDQCAHRLVPLSEGRVDPKTNCLECPYHGWQFESQTGKCAFIPQATRSSVNNNMNLVTPSINDRSMVSSFPVHLTPNILWAYLPMKESNKTVPELPEVMLPSLLTAKSFFSREVPYSFDVALENFMDPAHVPFAHHKLSNHRKQGAPLSIKLATNVQENEKELSFQYERDISPKFTLKALYSFYTPCYYQIRLFPSRTQQPTKQPQKDKSKQHPTKEHLISTENYRNVLSLLVVPMAPGRSRVFVVLPRAVGIASKFLPKWFQHRFWMRFFDSDIWLHDQEKVLRSPASSFDVQVNMNSSNVQNAPEKILDKFTLMTSADKGVIAWRQWWRKHM